MLDELHVLVEHGHVVEARPPHFYADEVVGRVDARQQRERGEDEELDRGGTFGYETIEQNDDLQVCDARLRPCKAERRAYS